MRLRAAVVAAAAALAAAPSHAGPHESSRLTATDVRIGDHPAFVRVVVDFTGSRVLTGQVEATDPDPYADGAVRLELRRPGVRTVVRGGASEGVTARVRRRAGRIVMHIRGAARRFKYAGYTALRDPERLVVDLWKTAPPSGASQVFRAPDRCLTLRGVSLVGRRVLVVRGTERHLFEHSLVVRLRDANGIVRAQVPVTAARGRWRARVEGTGRRRVRTLEAVAESAKDGSLDCLVQVGVVI